MAHATQQPPLQLMQQQLQPPLPELSAQLRNFLDCPEELKQAAQDLPEDSWRSLIRTAQQMLSIPGRNPMRELVEANQIIGDKDVPLAEKREYCDRIWDHLEPITQAGSLGNFVVCLRVLWNFLEGLKHTSISCVDADPSFHIRRTCLKGISKFVNSDVMKRFIGVCLPTIVNVIKTDNDDCALSALQFLCDYLRCHRGAADVDLSKQIEDVYESCLQMLSGLGSLKRLVPDHPPLLVSLKELGIDSSLSPAESNAALERVAHTLLYRIRVFKTCDDLSAFERRASSSEVIAVSPLASNSLRFRQDMSMRILTLYNVNRNDYIRFINGAFPGLFDSPSIELPGLDRIDSAPGDDGTSRESASIGEADVTMSENVSSPTAEQLDDADQEKDKMRRFRDRTLRSKLGLWQEFYSASQKSFTFIAVIMRHNSDLAEQYKEECVRLAFHLLRTCPASSIQLRRELHTTLKSMWQNSASAAFRQTFIDNIEELVKPAILIGNGWTVSDTLKGNAYAIIGEFIIQVKDDIPLKAYQAVIRQLGMNVFERQVPITMQNLTLRYLMAFTDPIVYRSQTERQPEHGKELILQVIEITTMRLKSLVRYHLPALKSKIMQIKRQFPVAFPEAVSAAAAAYPVTARSDNLTSTLHGEYTSPAGEQAELDEAEIMQTVDNVSLLADIISGIMTTMAKVMTNLDGVNKQIADLEQQMLAAASAGLTSNNGSVVGSETSASAVSADGATPAPTPFLMPGNVTSGSTAAVTASAVQTPLFMSKDAAMLARFVKYGSLALEALSLTQTLSFYSRTQQPNNVGSTAGSIRDGASSALSSAISAAGLQHQQSGMNAGGVTPSLNTSVIQLHQPHRNSQPVMEKFATVCFSFPHEVFRDVMQDQVDRLLASVAENSQMQFAVNMLQSGEKASHLSHSGIFTSLVLAHSIRHMESMSEGPESVRAELTLKNFKSIFGTVALFPIENESRFKPYLQLIVCKALEFANTARNPVCYFFMLRALFRSIGGGNHEALYSEFLPALPALMNVVSGYGSAIQQKRMRELFTELCLTVPVRLSSLLPHLVFLMEPLISALSADDSSLSLINQGLRTFELCVENLQSDFFFEHLQQIMPRLITVLWQIIRREGVGRVGSNALYALKILGKMGSYARRLVVTHQQLRPNLIAAENDINEHDRPAMLVHLSECERAVELPLVQPISLAFEILQRQQPSAALGMGFGGTSPSSSATAATTSSGNSGSSSASSSTNTASGGGSTTAIGGPSLFATGLTPSSTTLELLQLKRAALTLVRAHVLASIQFDDPLPVLRSILNAPAYRGSGRYVHESSLQVFEDMSQARGNVHRSSLAQTRETFVTALASLIVAGNDVELRVQVMPTLTCVVRHITLLAAVQQYGPKGATQWDRILNQQTTQNVSYQLDAFVLPDAINKVFSLEHVHLYPAALYSLHIMFETLQSFTGGQLEFVSDLPFVTYMADQLGKLCFDKAWFRKVGGLLGLSLYTEQMPWSWCVRHLPWLTKVLMYVPRDMDQTMSYGTHRLAEHMLHQLLYRVLTTPIDITTCMLDHARMDELRTRSLSTTAALFCANLNATHESLRQMGFKMLCTVAYIGQKHVKDIVKVYQLVAFNQPQPFKQQGMRGQSAAMHMASYDYNALALKMNVVKFNPKDPDHQSFIDDTLRILKYDEKALANMPFFKPPYAIDVAKYKEAQMNLLLQLHRHTGLRMAIYEALYRNVLQCQEPIQELAHSFLKKFCKLCRPVVIKVEQIETDAAFIIKTFIDDPPGDGSDWLEKQAFPKMLYIADFSPHLFSAEQCRTLCKIIHVALKNNAIEQKQSKFLTKSMAICTGMLDLIARLPNADDSLMPELVDAVISCEDQLSMHKDACLTKPLVKFLKRYPKAAAEYILHREKLLNYFWAAWVEKFIKKSPKFACKAIEQYRLDFISSLIAADETEFDEGAWTLHYAAVRIVKLMMKYDKSLLMRHRSLRQALQKTWHSEALQARHREARAPRSQWQLPNHIVDIMCMHLLQDPADLDVMFDLQLSWGRFLTDFTKLRTFLEFSVMPRLNMEERRNVLRKWIASVRDNAYEPGTLAVIYEYVIANCIKLCVTEKCVKSLVLVPLYAPDKPAGSARVPDAAVRRAAVRSVAVPSKIDDDEEMTPVDLQYASTLPARDSNVVAAPSPHNGATTEEPMQVDDFDPVDVENKNKNSAGAQAEHDDRNIIHQLIMLLDPARPNQYSEGLVCALLKLIYTVVEAIGTEFMLPDYENSKTLLHRIVAFCNSLRMLEVLHIKVDPLTLYSAQNLLALCMLRFDLPMAMMADTLKMLLKSKSVESRNVIKNAMSQTLPAFVAKGDRGREELLKVTQACLKEELNYPPNSMFIWQLLCKHAEIYFPLRMQLATWLINTMQKFAVTMLSCNVEQRKIVIDLAELFMKWEQMRRQHLLEWQQLQQQQQQQRMQQSQRNVEPNEVPMETDQQQVQRPQQPSSTSQAAGARMRSEASPPAAAQPQLTAAQAQQARKAQLVQQAMATKVPGVSPSEALHRQAVLASQNRSQQQQQQQQQKQQQDSPSQPAAKTTPNATYPAAQHAAAGANADTTPSASAVPAAVRVPLDLLHPYEKRHVDALGNLLLRCVFTLMDSQSSSHHIPFNAAPETLPSATAVSGGFAVQEYHARKCWECLRRFISTDFFPHCELRFPWLGDKVFNRCIGQPSPLAVAMCLLSLEVFEHCVVEGNEMIAIWNLNNIFLWLLQLLDIGLSNLSQAIARVFGRVFQRWPGDPGSSVQKPRDELNPLYQQLIKRIIDGLNDISSHQQQGVSPTSAGSATPTHTGAAGGGGFGASPAPALTPPGNSNNTSGGIMQPPPPPVTPNNNNNTNTMLNEQAQQSGGDDMSYSTPQQSASGVGAAAGPPGGVTNNNMHMRPLTLFGTLMLLKEISPYAPGVVDRHIVILLRRLNLVFQCRVNFHDPIAVEQFKGILLCSVEVLRPKLPSMTVEQRKAFIVSLANLLDRLSQDKVLQMGSSNTMTVDAAGNPIPATSGSGAASTAANIQALQKDATVAILNMLDGYLHSGSVIDAPNGLASKDLTALMIRIQMMLERRVQDMEIFDKFLLLVLHVFDTQLQLAASGAQDQQQLQQQISSSGASSASSSSGDKTGANTQQNKEAAALAAAAAVDIQNKLQVPFFCGLKSTDAELYQKFFSMFTSTLSERPLERLLFIFGSIDWSMFGTTYMSVCNHVLLSPAVNANDAVKLRGDITTPRLGSLPFSADIATSSAIVSSSSSHVPTTGDAADIDMGAPVDTDADLFQRYVDRFVDLWHVECEASTLPITLRCPLSGMKRKRVPDSNGMYVAVDHRPSAEEGDYEAQENDDVMDCCSRLTGGNAQPDVIHAFDLIADVDESRATYQTDAQTTAIGSGAAAVESTCLATTAALQNGDGAGDATPLSTTSTVHGPPVGELHGVAGGKSVRELFPLRVMSGDELAMAQYDLVRLKRETSTGDAVSALMLLCKHDNDLSHNLWIDIFPQVVRNLNDRQTTHLAQYINRFLASAVHNSSKESLYPPVRAFFIAVSRHKNLLRRLNPIVVEYLAENFGLWYEVQLLFENTVDLQLPAGVFGLAGAAQGGAASGHNASGGSSSKRSGSHHSSSTAQQTSTSSSATGGGTGGAHHPHTTPVGAHAMDDMPAFASLGANTQTALSIAPPPAAPSSKASTDPTKAPFVSVPECLTRLYDKLGEEDLHLAVWLRKVAGAPNSPNATIPHSEIAHALMFEQMRMWYRAYDVWDKLLQRVTYQADPQLAAGSSTAEQANFGNLLPLSDSNFHDVLLVKEHYIRACRQLNQWEYLANACGPEQLNEPVQQLDAVWRLPDALPQQREAIELLERVQPFATSTDNYVHTIRGYATLLDIERTDAGQAGLISEKLAEYAMQLAAKQFVRLPPVASTAHRKLLQQITFAQDLRDVAPLAICAGNVLNNGGLYDLQRVRLAIKHIKAKLPGPSDEFDVWSTTYCWRQRVLQHSINSFRNYHTALLSDLQIMQQNQQHAPVEIPNAIAQLKQFELLAAHASAQIAFLFGNAARKHGLTDVALDEMSKAPTDYESLSSDWADKMRNIIKLLITETRNTPNGGGFATNPEPLRTALGLLNDKCFARLSNNSEWLSQILVSKAAVYKEMAIAPVASTTSSASTSQQQQHQASQLELEITKCLTSAVALGDHPWKAWAKLGDHMIDMHERHGDFNSIKEAICCYCMVAQHVSLEQNVRPYIAKILWLLSFEDENDTLIKCFDANVASVPPAVWLPWINQLLNNMYRYKKDTTISKLLISVGKIFTQSVYIPMRAFYLYLRAMARTESRHHQQQQLQNSSGRSRQQQHQQLQQQQQFVTEQSRSSSTPAPGSTPPPRLQPSTPTRQQHPSDSNLNSGMSSPSNTMSDMSSPFGLKYRNSSGQPLLQRAASLASSSTPPVFDSSQPGALTPHRARLNSSEAGGGGGSISEFAESEAMSAPPTPNGTRRDASSPVKVPLSMVRKLQQQQQASSRPSGSASVGPPTLNAAARSSRANGAAAQQNRSSSMTAASPVMQRLSGIVSLLREHNPSIMNAIEAVLKPFEQMTSNWYEDILKQLVQVLHKCHSVAFEQLQQVHNVADARVPEAMAQLITQIAHNFGQEVDRMSNPRGGSSGGASGSSARATAATSSVNAPQRSHVPSKDKPQHNLGLASQLSYAGYDGNVAIFAELCRNFRDDFNFAAEPTSTKLNVCTVKLKHWIRTFERVARQCSVETLVPEKYRTLVCFNYAMAELTIFGEYSMPKAPTAAIKIAQFMSKIDLVFKSNTVCRRIYIRGHNGRVYPYLLQSDSTTGGHTKRKEERVCFLMRLLNYHLEQFGESQKRGLHLTVPRLVLFRPNMCLTEDNPLSVSLSDIHKQYCGSRHMDFDSPVTRYYERIMAQQSRGVALNPQIMRDAFRETQHALVPRTMLKQWAQRVFVDATEYIVFRRQLIHQHAAFCFLEYCLRLNRLMPDMLQLHLDSGNTNVCSYHFDTDDKTSRFQDDRLVPFRLTPNLSEYFTPFGVDGSFTMSLMVAAQALDKAEHKVLAYLRMILRDELIYWSMTRVEDHRGAASSSSGNNVAGDSSQASDNDGDSLMHDVATSARRNVATDHPPSSLSNAAVAERVGTDANELLYRIKKLASYENQAGVANAAQKLVNEARNPEVLCRMDPAWQPWL